MSGCSFISCVVGSRLCAALKALSQVLISALSADTSIPTRHSRRQRRADAGQAGRANDTCTHVARAWLDNVHSVPPRGRA